jgi:phage terminase large subunit
MPVSAAFDLGWRDSTAVWYFQPRPGGFVIVDHDEASGRTVDDWVDLLIAKGYDYDCLWLPHDARAKSMQTGRSTIEQLLAHGLPCRIAPELRVQQGIDAVRMVLPKAYFHEPTTRLGLRRLRAYGRIWNDKNQAFSNQPRHDENSHSADAFRMAALVMREHKGTPKRLYTAPATQHDGRYQLNVLWEAEEAARPQGTAAQRIDY